ncbi:MAG: hypothetical protein K6W08_12290 [Firmicutes bacterium]|nr:hypothetical protein [Bacillota bacterium]
MPDRYTKVVLTVIAAALVWLPLRPVVLPTPAEATSGLVRVRIEEVSPLLRPLPVKITDR